MLLDRFYGKNSNQFGVFASGLALGSIIGAGVALLLAPHSGNEVRAMIGEKSTEFKDQITDKANEVRNTAQHQFESGRRAINEQAFGNS